MKIQEIGVCEPIGVCVGFEISGQDLERVWVNNSWELTKDDGDKDSIPCLTPSGKVEIRPTPSQEELDREIIPLGMDFLVFRSREELASLLLEVYEIQL